MYRAPKKFVSGFGNMSNAVAKMARQGGKEAYEKVRPEFPDYSSMSFCRCLEEECTRRATEAVADMGPSVA